MIHSFLYRGDQASWANNPSDRQLLQGATGQLLPANSLTAVGDTEHLDRLDWSNRQEKTDCTLLSFILLQDLFCWLRTPSPWWSWSQFCTLGIGQWDNATFNPQTWTADCQGSLSFLSWFCFQNNHMRTVVYLLTYCMTPNVWYQTGHTLCFP